MQEHSLTPSNLLSTSQPLVFCLLNSGHSPIKSETTRDVVNWEMLQNLKCVCGLFYAMVELVLTEDTLFRRPLDSVSSISTDALLLTVAQFATQLTGRLSLQ